MLFPCQPKLLHRNIQCVAIADVPDAHSRAGDDRETDGSGETLVTLGIIVLEADLEFDGFEEVSLLGLERVLEERLDVGTHSGCGKLSAFIQRRGDRGVEGGHRIPTVILDMLTVFQ
jgi:hypothetical protein